MSRKRKGDVWVAQPYFCAVSMSGSMGLHACLYLAVALLHDLRFHAAVLCHRYMKAMRRARHEVRDEVSDEPSHSRSLGQVHDPQQHNSTTPTKPVGTALLPSTDALSELTSMP